MIELSRKILGKLKQEGAMGLWRAFRRKVWREKPTPVLPAQPELIRGVLEGLARSSGSVCLVQIGAHTGNTSNDPFYDFLKKHGSRSAGSGAVNCSAVLVEPVGYLFERLKQNYADCEGIAFEQAAIAEAPGVRDFYRLREDVNPAAHGFPDWLDQVGSLLPERLGEMWNGFEGNQAYKAFLVANTVVEKVRCITFAQLLEKHQLRKIDFLQIDAEGYDYQILRSIPFERITPQWINYERALLREKEKRCRQLLIRQGYQLQDHGIDTLCRLQQ
jgi:FkbM family methyltransferase